MGRKLPPEILTDDEVCALIRACSSGAPTGVRNRALIAILYRGASCSKTMSRANRGWVGQSSTITTASRLPFRAGD